MRHVQPTAGHYGHRCSGGVRGTRRCSANLEKRGEDSFEDLIEHRERPASGRCPLHARQTRGGDADRRDRRVGDRGKPQLHA